MYKPLTFNFSPQEWPFILSELALFSGGELETPPIRFPARKTLGGSHFHCGHGHGSGAKHQNTWVESFQKRSETFNFLSKCYIWVD